MKDYLTLCKSLWYGISETLVIPSHKLWAFSGWGLLGVGKVGGRHMEGGMGQRDGGPVVEVAKGMKWNQDRTIRPDPNPQFQLQQCLKLACWSKQQAQIQGDPLAQLGLPRGSISLAPW